MKIGFSKRFYHFCYWHVIVKLILLLDPWLMGIVCAVPYHYYLLEISHWWMNLMVSIVVLNQLNCLKEIGL